MAFTFEENKMYMMPVCFGPGPGMMQNPDDGRRHLYGQLRYVTNHTLAYESNPAQLEKLLPKEFTLDKPYVIMNHRMNRNLAWLGGRGYNLVSVTIPATFHGKAEKIKGAFMVAIWENDTEPILAGREQLGYGKQYAQITDVINYKGVGRTIAMGYDFPFLRMKFDLNREPDNLDEVKDALFDPEYTGDMNFKYIPKTGGNFDQADVSYYTLNPLKITYPEGVAEMPAPVITYGTGSIQWYRPDYEDMPTQGHIVQGLCDLELKRVIGAARVDAVNLADCYDVRIIE